MPRTALITGITGQDGSYLAELLVSKGYAVHGIVRRVALEDPEHRLARLGAVRDRITLHAASLESFASIYNAVAQIVPDECYHLAAQSFVSYSFDDEFSTLNANINGTHFMLAASRISRRAAVSTSRHPAKCSATRKKLRKTSRPLPSSLQLRHQ